MSGSMQKILGKYDRKEYLELLKINPKKIKCPKCGAGFENMIISPRGVVMCINQIWYEDLKMKNQCRQIIARPSTKALYGVSLEDF